MAYRSPYPDITVPSLSLYDMVLGGAPGRPDAVAMADAVSGRTLTYAQLMDQIRRVAAGLAARGIKKGDVVSLWSPNLPEWPAVFFGAVRLGAIVHTSNPVSTRKNSPTSLRMPAPECCSR
jgi:acyl-CoA synthetase (AMP-forming)/AMP-acid ligase II